MWDEDFREEVKAELKKDEDFRDEVKGEMKEEKRDQTMWKEVVKDIKNRKRCRGIQERIDEGWFCVTEGCACDTSVVKGGLYCKRHQEQADANANGKPTSGCIVDLAAWPEYSTMRQ